MLFFHRHFLFKQGSGSSALLSGAGQGYPLTSGTVYSPPPRPLPRSSVTRPLFTFNKPHRCCNWKCTALSASLLTLTLALLLTYVIGELQDTSITHATCSCAAEQEMFLFLLILLKESTDCEREQELQDLSIDCLVNSRGNQ